MFGLVSFHLIFLILEYVACFFMNLFISTFWHFPCWFLWFFYCCPFFCFEVLSCW